MTGLIDAALDRSRMVLLALALILIAGSVAYIQIPKEAQPEIKIPVIYVSMTTLQPLGESFSVGTTKLPAALLIRISRPP